MLGKHMCRHPLTTEDQEVRRANRRRAREQAERLEDPEECPIWVDVLIVVAGGLSLATVVLYALTAWEVFGL